MKKKVLFIDRDGTIIIEPPDEQVDSFEKMEFYPRVIHHLRRIATELDFELVMVTNQDGLGTDSFPEETFWPVQNKMLQILESEGIRFDDIIIDKTFPHENAPTRKPGIALLTKYLNGSYNLQNSFVIGDRKTDIQLAKNLGCQAIYIHSKKDRDAVLTTLDWNEIYNFLAIPERVVEKTRKTHETDIKIKINLDGTGKSNINSGIGFYDHMLELFAKHASCDLALKVKGDLQVDEHHTVEDTALCLGEAILEALGDKRGIERYGFLLPMDESIAEVAIDFSGRPELVWKTKFKREKVGELPSELFQHFFKSFSNAAQCNLYIKAKGENEHHKIEAIFKAFAKSVKMAVKREPGNRSIPSTKGSL